MKKGAEQFQGRHEDPSPARHSFWSRPSAAEAHQKTFHAFGKAVHSPMNFLRILLLLTLCMTTALAGPFRVVCLGDSITGPGPDVAGKPTENEPGVAESQQREYLNAYAKYSDLLQLVLQTHLGTANVQIFNRGWAGNTSTQALARVDSSVVPLKPNVVTILIGGNDFGGGVTDTVKAQLLTNLTTIVDKCKAAGAKVLLLEYATPRADDMSHVWTNLNAGNPVIVQVARTEHVPMLELAPQFDEAAKTHHLDELASPHDGVHYNPYGEIVTARAIYFKLRELGWLPQR
jgi:lysophospholipase L1-like esterase